MLSLVITYCCCCCTSLFCIRYNYSYNKSHVSCAYEVIFLSDLVFEVKKFEKEKEKVEKGNSWRGAPTPVHQVVKVLMPKLVPLYVVDDAQPCCM